MKVMVDGEALSYRLPPWKRRSRGGPLPSPITGFASNTLSAGLTCQIAEVSVYERSLTPEEETSIDRYPQRQILSRALAPSGAVAFQVVSPHLVHTVGGDIEGGGSIAARDHGDLGGPDLRIDQLVVRVDRTVRSSSVQAQLLAVAAAAGQ